LLTTFLTAMARLAGTMSTQDLVISSLITAFVIVVVVPRVLGLLLSAIIYRVKKDYNISVGRATLGRLTDVRIDAGDGNLVTLPARTPGLVRRALATDAVPPFPQRSTTPTPLTSAGACRSRSAKSPSSRASSRSPPSRSAPSGSHCSSAARGCRRTRAPPTAARQSLAQPTAAPSRRQRRTRRAMRPPPPWARAQPSCRRARARSARLCSRSAFSSRGGSRARPSRWSCAIRPSASRRGPAPGSGGAGARRGSSAPLRPAARHEHAA